MYISPEAPLYTHTHAQKSGETTPPPNRNVRLNERPPGSFVARSKYTKNNDDFTIELRGGDDVWFA